MAVFDRNKAGGPETGQARKRLPRSSPPNPDPAAQVALVADAWARHAAASGGFGDADTLADEGAGMGRRRH